jgi:hypothetical protein
MSLGIAGMGKTTGTGVIVAVTGLLQPPKVNAVKSTADTIQEFMPTPLL